MGIFTQLLAVRLHLGVLIKSQSLENSLSMDLKAFWRSGPLSPLYRWGRPRQERCPQSPSRSLEEL